MPRYYCDYCDAYLTHDSMAGRQQHMRGQQHSARRRLILHPCERSSSQLSYRASLFSPPPFARDFNADFLFYRMEAPREL